MGFLLNLCCCICLLILFHVEIEATLSSNVSNTNYNASGVTSQNASYPRLRCKYTMDVSLLQMNITLKNRCCSKVTRMFRTYWNHSTMKLADYLRALKMWECSKFEDECQKRYYAYSKYTSLIYDRFCSPAKYENHCLNEVAIYVQSEKLAQNRVYSEAEGSGNDDAFSQHNFSSGWSEKLHVELLSGNITRENQMEPCVQAALVNIQNFSAGRYFEAKQSEMAFCDISWCAFSTDIFKNFRVSDSMCMSNKCTRNIYIMMATAGFLAVLTTSVNLLVLIIFASNRRLMNSQGIYKMSLAAADLLVGLFVFPLFIETMRRSFLTRYEVIPEKPIEYGWGSGTNGTRLILENFDETFFGVAGFFTTLSLTASMYSLMVASFDRLLVVYRPLEYNQFQARKVAKRCVAFLWLLGILFSVLPLVVTELQYMRVASILVCVGGGDVALILYVVTFALPLLLVWSLNIATFCYSKRNAQVRPRVKLPKGSNAVTENLETRLAKTLSIMVGVFTVCILPVSILLISELFLEGIHLQTPEKFHMPTAVTVMSLEAVSAFILMSNSLWNFFIYNARSQEFRACLGMLLRKVRVTCCRSCYDDNDLLPTSKMANASSTTMQAQRKNTTVTTKA